MATKKIKQLKLKPSARDKRRYLLIQKVANKQIEEAILEYIGTLGFAQAAYKKVISNDFPGYTIGSCLAKKLVDVRAGLALAGIEIEKVSGTIKGLGKKK